MRKRWLSGSMLSAVVLLMFAFAGAAGAADPAYRCPARLRFAVQHWWSGNWDIGRGLPT